VRRESASSRFISEISRVNRPRQPSSEAFGSALQNGVFGPGQRVMTRSRVISSIRQLEAPRGTSGRRGFVDHLLVELSHSAAPVDEMDAVQTPVGDRARVRATASGRRPVRTARRGRDPRRAAARGRGSAAGNGRGISTTGTRIAGELVPRRGARGVDLTRRGLSAQRATTYCASTSAGFRERARLDHRRACVQ
jgi:hypothetical protein